ncbi:4745_t:CDS:2, partial [Acaulospora colombiana]
MFGLFILWRPRTDVKGARQASSVAMAEGGTGRLSLNAMKLISWRRTRARIVSIEWPCYACTEIRGLTAWTSMGLSQAKARHIKAQIVRLGWAVNVQRPKRVLYKESTILG